MLVVADWNTVFENALSRKIETLPWIRMPNRHDGYSFIELLEGHPDGAAHYGCWALLIQVASTTHQRGSLIRKDGSPHTAESVSRIVRVKHEVMKTAISRLVDIGWLVDTTRPVSSIPPGYHPTGTTTTEKHAGEERRGEERREDTCSPPAPQAGVFLHTAEFVYEQYPRKKQRSSALRAIKAAAEKPDVIRAAKELGSQCPMTWLYRSTMLYRCFVDDMKTEEKFIPYPATWFRAEGYFDADFTAWCRKQEEED